MEILEKVQKLIEQPIHNNNWNDYINLYHEATGFRWTGCKCKKERLRIALQEWYNKNKIK